ncbi:N-acetyltransferase family protein, partial [uncultured Anaerotruncus sp.]
MQVTVRKFTAADLPAMTAIWNGIVEEGNSFPQDKPFTEDEAREFFAAQSFTGVAEADGKVLGLYILHPNNAGRCGHIANASYGVASGA